MKNLELLIEMFMSADPVGAQDLLREYVLSHGYENMILDLLGPSLLEVGKRWDSQDCSLAHAYVAIRTAEKIMTDYVSPEAHEKINGAKGPVVMGNIEDDFHGLGRSLVTAFLKVDGWTVHDLGNDIPAEEFVNSAIDLGAKVIGVSAMMYSTAENIKAVRAEIDRRDLTGGVQLAVGGAVFILHPELVQEVGGDGTARNALDAPALFAELHKKACKSGVTP